MARAQVIVSGEVAQNNAEAGEAFDPGTLVEKAADGTLQAAATDGVPADLVALDRPELGRGIDDGYSAGEDAKYGSPQTGTVTQTLLADAQDVDPSTPLVPNGAGALREMATDADGNYTEWDALYGYPEESENNTSGEAVLIEVRKA